MKITLAQLRKVPRVDKLVIHSLDLALYQASVMVEGEEFYVVDDHGRHLRKHNKLELQAMFHQLPVMKTVLRHQSAYDEMIGQPLRDGGNFLEVELGDYHSPGAGSELH